MFLEASDADSTEKRLAGRADLACVIDGGYASAERRRLIFANPEMLDTIEPQTALLRINGADWTASPPLANALEQVGVPLEQVGDIYIAPEDDAAYVVVAADFADRAARLLPKSLVGAGCRVERLAPGASPDGALQPTELKRVDKRANKK